MDDYLHRLGGGRDGRKTELLLQHASNAVRNDDSKRRPEEENALIETLYRIGTAMAKAG